MARLIDVETAIAALDAGGIVAVPTDTVYGFAAEIHHPSALVTLFAMKNRPAKQALPILIDSIEQISHLGVTWDGDAQRLGDVFWPGALTIVVAAPHKVAGLVGSLTDTIGLRIPDDDLLRRIIAVIGPLAVSSANVHGEPPCFSADDVLREFAECDELAGVIDDGERSGDVSTVVDLSVPTWRILREGAISTAQIAEALA